MFRVFIKETIRKFTSRMTRRVIFSLKNEFFIYCRHKSNFVIPSKIRKLKKLQKIKNKKLHIGCGKKYKKGWINIDLNSPADLNLDLREKIPFKDNSVTTIYSEHFLEHLEYPNDVLFFLKECLRVLKKGEKFVCGVPDMRNVLQSFLSKKKTVLQIMKQRKYFSKDCQTDMDFINWSFRQGGEHKYAYDYITLKKILKRAGFIKVNKRPWKRLLDSEEWSSFTFYVEAVKPF